MTHDYSLVFDTESPYWQKVLDIFAKNEKYEKKVVSNRNLHHKFPRSFSKKLGEEVDNDKDNLISLSLADHFLVHYYYYLLARKGYRQAMATAFTFMAKKCLKYITPETAEAMAKDYEEAKCIADQGRSEANKGERNPNYGRTGEKHPFYGKTHSDETRKKMSDSLKGRIPSRKGAVLSEETRIKLSDSLKGHTVSEDTRKKMSDAHKGKPRKPFSDEHRRKLHEAWQRRKAATNK